MRFRWRVTGTDGVTRGSRVYAYDDEGVVEAEHIPEVLMWMLHSSAATEGIDFEEPVTIEITPLHDEDERELGVVEHVEKDYEITATDRQRRLSCQTCGGCGSILVHDEFPGATTDDYHSESCPDCQPGHSVRVPPKT